MKLSGSKRKLLGERGRDSRRSGGRSGGNEEKREEIVMLKVLSMRRIWSSLMRTRVGQGNSRRLEVVSLSTRMMNSKSIALP